MVHKNDKNRIEICVEIQKRIEDLNSKNINLDSNPDIVEHLKHCAECRAFQVTLDTLKSHFQDPPVHGLKSNSHIRKNILNYFELKKRIYTRKDEKFLEWIKSVFTVRIPVYQALSGLAVLILLVVFLSGNSTHGLWWMEIDHSGKTEMYKDSNLYVLDTLHLLNTSNGQNALEDSILVGFLESSL